MRPLSELLDSVQTVIVVTTSVLGIIGVIIGSDVRDFLIKIIRWPFVTIWKFLDKSNLEQKIDSMIEAHKVTANTLNRVEKTTTEVLDTLQLKQGLMTSKFLAFLDQPHFLPMFESDKEGKCIWVSANYLSLTGRPFDQLVGWGWVNAIHEDDVKEVRARWEQAIEEKRIFEMRYRFRHIEGDVINVETKAQPVILNGNIEGWFGFVEILSEQE